MTRRLVVDDDVVDMAHELRGLLVKPDSTGYTVSEAMRYAIGAALDEVREQMDEEEAG